MITNNYNKALSTLDTGLQQYPENNALKILQSLVLYSLGKQGSSIKTLLDILLNTSLDEAILIYSRQIRTCLCTIDGEVID